MSTDPIRSITYNVLRCTGWNRRFDQAKRPQPERPLVPDQMTAALGAYKPDIITLSEAPDPGITHGMAAQLGMKCVHFDSPAGFPGALLTRFEIVDHVNCPTPTGYRPDGLFTRHWGKVTLRTPGGSTLVVYTTHLYPGREPEDRAIRQREQAMLLDAVRLDLIAERDILLQGDLNHLPDDPEIGNWRDAWLVDTYTGPAADGFTVEADRRVARIDYILLGGPIVERPRKARTLAEGPFVVDPEDEAGFALSDHVPFMVDIG